MLPDKSVSEPVKYYCEKELKFVIFFLFTVEDGASRPPRDGYRREEGAVSFLKFYFNHFLDS